MANSLTITQAPATGAVAMYVLLAHLEANGWVVQQDSDGTTYSAGGTQLTSGAAGANGFGNNSAWFVVREPVASGGVREFCVQKSDAGSNAKFRIKRSPAVKFTGGTPNPTRVPSATDEVVMLGGGTDAAPTYATLFDGDGTYLIHTVVQNASTWSFALRAYAYTGGGDTNAMFFSDPATSLNVAQVINWVVAKLNEGMLDVGGAVPVVTLVSPALGTAINRNHTLVFDVTDAQSALANVEVIVKFPSGRWEAANDGTSWSGQYETSSVRTVIADGYRFSIVRTGGWPQTPTVLFRAVDSAGNVNS